MINIKIDGKTLGEVEELKPTTKIKFDKISVSYPFSIEDKKDHNPPTVFFVEDDCGNVWGLENAWISDVSYDYEDNGVIIEEIGFIEEDK